MNVSDSTRMSTLGPVLVHGFAAALAVWVSWFLTHLPWLGLGEQVALPVILGVWVVAMCWCGLRVRSLRVSTLAGLVSASLGLLILGSKLAQPADASGVSAGVRPMSALIAVGFLALGAGLGAIGGLFGIALARRDQGSNEDSGRWLAQFALVTCVAITPLLFVGGLVTSTDSGMAVPDWPNTYASNMFLYPLGPRTSASVYLEHAHRLFGSLVGLTILTLMVWVWRKDARRWVRVLAGVAFGLVVIQGVMGGLRVTQGSRGLAMAHGVLGQIVFATAVVLVVVLSPMFRAQAGRVDATVAKRLKRISTALLHTLILQLLLGAAYRQFRSDHILYTHVAFSFAVLVLALLAGLTLSTAGEDLGPRKRTFERIGSWMLAVVVVQFLLGWVAFFVGGRAHVPTSEIQAIVRTVHQANGALLLALATAGFVWSRRVVFDAQEPTSKSTGASGVPVSA